MAYKFWVPRELLKAQDVNNYLMNQALIQVPDTATRDAYPNPVAGMRIEVTPTGAVYRYNGTAWVQLPTGTDAGAFVSGTLANAVLPARLQETTPVISGDLNAQKITGWYRGQNISSAPTSDWCFFEVLRYDDNYVHQTAYHLFSNQVWTRHEDNGSWSGWQKQMYVDDTMDIARVTHSAYNGGGLNGFWQGYLPDTYYNKGQVDSTTNGIYSNYDNGRLDGRTNSLIGTAINNRGINAFWSTSFSMSAGTTPVTANVTFPGGRFSSAPNTTVSVNTGSPQNYSIGYSNRTASGVTVVLYRSSSGSGIEVSLIAALTY